ncbi:unnamed protein product [Hyaloperonospora brassicae]|uniref:Uncharacterized protein n=1 Tax=Hyaloperonospora brassicae TaxID=162125 RepID=A0AAV0TS44_HYABA|nr:unnamed protein product [Hyaloperonospora brassicae]
MATAHPTDESACPRAVYEPRLDLMQRRCSLPKITGRKLRTPRKFVVTDVSDDELEQHEPRTTRGPCAGADASGVARDELDEHRSQGLHRDELSACSASLRKGKTQVRGRFTITDLSPESPDEPLGGCRNLAASTGPMPLQTTNGTSRRPSKRMVSRKPFQSAGDVRPLVGLTTAPNQLQQQQPQQQPQQQQTDGTHLFASFQCTGASSPSSRSTRTSSVACPVSSQVSCSDGPTPTVFDHHFEFLERETFEMKSALETMVATNAQWIETLTSAGLVRRGEGRSEVAVPEPIAPAAPSFEQRYCDMEKAYTELQIKYEAVCQKSERMEVKNAMLEIRLQQQSNHSTMLRSQLDKLTEYTEKLLGESSEPTLHDYSSDLTSIFGEHSETHSPTADKLAGGGSSGFTYDVVKSRRQHRRGMDEECMSDSGTEDESFRKTSSLPPFHQSNGSCRYFSDMDLTTADLSSENERGSPAALDSLLNDQVDQLRQSLRLRNKTDADEPVSVIGSLDSMAVCPSVTNVVGSYGDDEYHGTGQVDYSRPVSSEGKEDGMLKHRNSVSSLNYLTVSSTSSLAGYGLHLATMAQSKASYYASIAATSLFGPHPEPYPSAAHQQPTGPQDDETKYNVLSPENLLFHDCQSLLQAAEERRVQNSSSRRGFLFAPSKKATSSLGAKEVPGPTESGGGLFQRLTVRRR